MKKKVKIIKGHWASAIGIFTGKKVGSAARDEYEIKIETNPYGTVVLWLQKDEFEEIV